MRASTAASIPKLGRDRRIIDSRREVALRRLSELRDEASRVEAGIEVRVELLRGSLPDALIDLLENPALGPPRAGLLIVGTHGRTGVARVLLGSVAERLVRHAPCPVLVIRPEHVE